MDRSQLPYNKIPFYLTYPMQNMYETEMEYERDMQRMKDLYPKDVRKIMVCIEEQCDELEYEGSFMYDESPDRFMVLKMTDRIYDKISKEKKQERERDKILEGDRKGSAYNGSDWYMPYDQDVLMQQMIAHQQYRRPLPPPIPGPPTPPQPPMPPGPPLPPGHPKLPEAPMPPKPPKPLEMNNDKDPNLYGLIGVLLSDEMYRRRCRNRRCRRWW